MTERTCIRCGRPVGMLANGRARPYVVELNADGVGPVCHDRGSCKIARLNGEAA